MLTEAKWSSSTDPRSMLDTLLGGGEGNRMPGVTDRKLRLWIEACRQAVVDAEGVLTIWRDLEKYPEEIPECLQTWSHCERYTKQLPPAKRADFIRCIFGNPWRPAVLQANEDWQHWYAGGGKGRVDMVEPPRFVTPTWLTPTVLAVAGTIYESRRFENVGILADALEEAGCPDKEPCQACGGRGYHQWDLEDGGSPVMDCYCKRGRVPNPLLAHLRGPGPHARGCHVLDAILAKG